MKTLKINKLILLLIGLVVFNGCVEDDDFAIPNTNIIEPTFNNGELIIPISSVAGDLAQEQGGGQLDYNDDDTLFAFPTDGNDIFVEGYVISSDEGGNYFEELVLQNSPENPTLGIRVLIDVNPLFTRYEVGRKVFIKLNGLVAGISNGVLTIGPQDGDRIGKIAFPDELNFILRSSELATIVPLPMTISDFTDDKTNLLIQLEDVQFNKNEALGTDTSGPLSFASEQFDQFDGERTLEDCISGSSAVFATSTFADFKGLTLPAGRGSVTAVLQKNFFGDEFNVVINTPEDINFNNDDRCDPAEFIIGTPVDCDDTPVNGATTIFEEDFESFSNAGDLTAAGWTLINISGGSYTWGISGFGGNTYAIGNAFNTDEFGIDTWLISPEIDLDGTTEDVLNFDVQTNFNGGEVMSVYISTDFVDTTTDSNWSLLDDVTIPNGPSNGFGSFQAAGPVNLSCVTGTVRIAFRYTGSDPGITTRYHVDNVEVTGN
ncbi:MAG: hypothetical protein ED556_02105 [Winogradskyella sp.]|uniref:DUF5689 domain-containing protein n=1 Tax=Winogradskyella sp. TaxID=1883156 RepID=UPI000F3C1EFE|nr:DUF5689 domain-containing protein [Winogradskyella sp.]RNC88005.1 MAG: hypothetical protein ED556_02105 [Winogradskyella sp.]